MALFVISGITLIAMLGILFPVVRQVNTSRIKILSLFVDIPYSIAIKLQVKCQRFIVAASDEKHMAENGDETEIGSEEDGEEQLMEEEDEDGGGGSRKSKNRARQPIYESAMNDNTFIIRFGFAMLGLMAYFSTMIFFSLRYQSKIKMLTNEMNLLAQAESYYAFA